MPSIMRTESNHRRPRRHSRLDFVQRVKTGHVMNVKHAGWPSNVKCDNLDSEKQVSLDMILGLKGKGTVHQRKPHGHRGFEIHRCPEIVYFGHSLVCFNLNFIEFA